MLGAYAVINFDTSENEIQYTNGENLPIDDESTTITLTPDAVPTVVGTKFYMLEIVYYQEVNGSQYLLNNGSFNGLSIIAIQNPVI